MYFKNVRSFFWSRSSWTNFFTDLLRSSTCFYTSSNPVSSPSSVLSCSSSNSPILSKFKMVMTCDRFWCSSSSADSSESTSVSFFISLSLSFFSFAFLISYRMYANNVWVFIRLIICFISMSWRFLCRSWTSCINSRLKFRYVFEMKEQIVSCCRYLNSSSLWESNFSLYFLIYESPISNLSSIITEPLSV